MGIEAIPSYNFRMDTINLGWMYKKYVTSYIRGRCRFRFLYLSCFELFHVVGLPMDTDRLVSRLKAGEQVCAVDQVGESSCSVQGLKLFCRKTKQGCKI